MQTQSKIFIGLGIIILAVVVFNLSKEDEQSSLAAHDSNMADSAEMMDSEVEAAEMMDDDDEMDSVHPATPTEVFMGGADKETLPETPTEELVAGTYTTYTPAAVTNSEAESIVLNFSATWCPSCRTVDKDINTNLSSIPAGVEIYKVDYDTNIALRKQYGITTQHTFVVVNSDGTMIKKWVGGSTLNDILTKL